MPLVLAEGEMAGTPNAGAASRRPRRPTGLPLLCALLALLIAVPLLPLARPVKLRVSGWVVIIGTTTRFATGSAVPSHGFSASAVPYNSELTDLEGVDYLMQGSGRVYALRLKDWAYYLVWFRGHRK